MSELAGYWIELQCCSAKTLIPCNLIVSTKGGHYRLAAVMAKLRCKRCNGPLVRAWPNETHNRVFVRGAQPGWSVNLIPLTRDSP